MSEQAYAQGGGTNGSSNDSAELLGQRLRSRSRNLVMLTDTRLMRDEDGLLWSTNPFFDPTELAAYKATFDKVTLVTRVFDLEGNTPPYLVDTSWINVIELPTYQGIGYFLKRRRIGRYLKGILNDPEAYYCVWLPRPIGNLGIKILKRLNVPIYARVIGDPYGVANAILPSRLGPLVAHYSRNSMRRAVRSADAVSYVTFSQLQELYPPSQNSVTLARCNVNLRGEIESITKKKYDETLSTLSLIAVGSQEQNYKGHDVLISAVSELKARGYRPELTLVGDGAMHPELVAQARMLNLNEVRFVKSLGTSVDVAKELVNHDLFVMPSRTEGMPKAMIEAMYVGVCSIGSRVGGIPELLEDDCIFEPDSPIEIVRTIERFLHNPDMFADTAARQQQKAEEIRLHHSGVAALSEFLSKWVARYDG